MFTNVIIIAASGKGGAGRRPVPSFSSGLRGSPSGSRNCADRSLAYATEVS